MMETEMEDRRGFDTTLAEGLRELILIAKQGSKDLTDHMAREESDIGNIQKEIVKSVGSLEKRIDEIERLSRAEISKYHDGHNPDDVRKNDEWTTKKRLLEERKETANLDKEVQAKWDWGSKAVVFLIGLTVMWAFNKVETTMISPAISKHEQAADKKFDVIEQQIREIKDLLKNAPSKTGP